MAAALLESKLTERLGAGAALIRSSGFGPVDLPAIDDAVAAMRRRGLDVSTHRSSATTASLVDGADLILTAERDHVVKIAALSPAAFRRALTLPEFLAAAAHVGGDDDGRRHPCMGRVADGRANGGEYLRADVPEVDDPTGSAPRAFEAAVVAIEQQCDDVVGAAHTAPEHAAPRLAERGGFEPPEPFGSSAFKAGAFVHSATVPGSRLPALHSGAPRRGARAAEWGALLRR